MHKFIIKKLVRDKIPYIMEHDDNVLETEIRTVDDDQEYDALLRAKLREEAAEVGQAKNPTELLEELADVMEVVNTLCEFHGIEDEDLIEALDKKLAEKGGFVDKVYCEYIVPKTDSEFEKKYIAAGVPYVE